MASIRELSYSYKVHDGDLAGLGIDHVLFGGSIDEDRARTATDVLGASAAKMYQIDLVDDFALELNGDGPRYNLYEAGELSALVSQMRGRVAIDLTSLEHKVWAPLVRVLIEGECELLALYAEPRDYRRNDSDAGALYDLSSTRGIEPLPGFAGLGRRGEDAGGFAPMLGFEGARLQHIFDQEDVRVGNTSPIVGLPGFRLEYSMHSYVANRDILDQGRMEDRIEFAAANSPFEAFRALERVHHRIGGAYFRIAPIGTKPHALGAVLYAIQNSDSVGLIYDHPVRASNRTEGTSTIYVYEVTQFLQRDLRPS